MVEAFAGLCMNSHSPYPREEPNPAPGWSREFRFAVIAVLAFGVLVALYGSVSSSRRYPVSTRSISSIKQLATAVLIYCSDHGERMPLAWHTGSYSVAAPHPDSNSIYAITPYLGTRSSEILQPIEEFRSDDLATHDVPVAPGAVATQHSADQAAFNLALKSRFGFNSQFMHPQGWDGQSVTSLPVSTDEIASPSEALMVISSTWTQDGHGRTMGGGRSEVDAPCIYDSKFRDLRPGMGRFAAYYGVMGWRTADKRSPYVFGGAWPIHEGRFLGSFADGSAKVLPLGKLVAGCDVMNSHGGTVYDSKAYIWDVSE